MSEPHARKDDSTGAAVRWELRRLAYARPLVALPRTLAARRGWESLVNGVASLRARIERLLEATRPDERTAWHLAPRRSRSDRSALRR
jgi:hypothetical protein